MVEQKRSYEEMYFATAAPAKSKKGTATTCRLISPSALIVTDMTANTAVWHTPATNKALVIKIIFSIVFFEVQIQGLISKIGYNVLSILSRRTLWFNSLESPH